MIDSGATSSFINKRYVDELHFPTQPRKEKIELRDIDGRPLGIVDRQVNANIRIGSHQENLQLDVAPVGRHPVVLGLPWLRKHDPIYSLVGKPRHL